jgi:hypothetical protein
MLDKPLSSKKYISFFIYTFFITGFVLYIYHKILLKYSNQSAVASNIQKVFTSLDQVKTGNFEKEPVVISNMPSDI